MTFQFILLLIFLIAAPAWSQTGKPSSAADLASYTSSDRERLLFEGAKREGKLVRYTTLAAEQNKTIAGAFDKKYPGVSVDTFRTGSSALAQRLLTEAKARRHLAAQKDYGFKRWYPQKGGTLAQYEESLDKLAQVAQRNNP